MATNTHITSITIDNPRNFLTAHRPPQIDDLVVFTPRQSDTLAPNQGGMALMNGDDFLGWIRA